MDKQQLRQLQEFVEVCKANPEVLHMPELGFYREWLHRYVMQCGISCLLTADGVCAFCNILCY